MKMDAGTPLLQRLAEILHGESLLWLLIYKMGLIRKIE